MHRRSSRSNPAPDLEWTDLALRGWGLYQRRGGLRRRDAERPRQGDGAQRVVGAERPRRQHPHRGGFAAMAAGELNAQRRGAGHV